MQKKEFFYIKHAPFFIFKNEFIHHYKRSRSPFYYLVEKQERNLINQCCSPLIFGFFSNTYTRRL
jgi:hypothetical protein